MNMATFWISAGLLVVVGLIIWKMVSDKKKGKSGCGCGCENCPSGGMCHPEQKPKE